MGIRPPLPGRRAPATSNQLGFLLGAARTTWLEVARGILARFDDPQAAYQVSGSLPFERSTHPCRGVYGRLLQCGPRPAAPCASCGHRLGPRNAWIAAKSAKGSRVWLEPCVASIDAAGVGLERAQTGVLLGGERIGLGVLVALDRIPRLGSLA